MPWLLRTFFKKSDIDADIDSGVDIADKRSYSEYCEKDIEGYCKRFFLRYLKKKEMNECADGGTRRVMYKVRIGKHSEAGDYLQDLKADRHKKTDNNGLRVFKLAHKEGEKHSDGDKKNDIN